MTTISVTRKKELLLDNKRVNIFLFKYYTYCYDKSRTYAILFRLDLLKGCLIMLVTVFAIVCLATVLLNVGYCLFDHEYINYTLKRSIQFRYRSFLMFYL